MPKDIKKDTPLPGLQEIVNTVVTKTGKRERISPFKHGLRKGKKGMFQAYYGTKFFCTETGAVYVLNERDPKTGLSILRMNRLSIPRVLKMNRYRLLMGVAPVNLHDIYLSDAEVVLLLREYPLPHLGLDLRLLTRESIEKAIEVMDETIAALQDEIYIRNFNRRHLVKLKLKKDTVDKIPPLTKYSSPDVMTSSEAIKALKGVNKKVRALNKKSEKKLPELTSLPTGRPVGRPRIKVKEVIDPDHSS